MRAAFNFLWASICHALFAPQTIEVIWSPRLAESEAKHEASLAMASDNKVDASPAPEEVDAYPF